MNKRKLELEDIINRLTDKAIFWEPNADEKKELKEAQQEYADIGRCMDGFPLSEADLQRSVADFLQYQQNLGKLWFTRLNSGRAFVKKGDKYYAIQLCEIGTADFMVLVGKTFQFSHTIRPTEDAETTAWFPYCKIMFFELKSSKGRTSKAQDEFAELVRKQGAEYFVVKSLEELEDILGK